ncbi:MAG: archease [Gemmatimonadota bacterium]
MERGEFVELDHTADVGLALRGATPGAILEAAQRGLICLLMGDLDGLQSDTARTVTLSSASYPDLLKAWCELVYRLLEDDGFVALQTEIRSVEPTALVAQLLGTCPPRDRVTAASELKAVTYHQLAFEPAPGGWHGRVVFDV